MHNVFAKVSYDVFNIPGFFTEFKKFIGYFKIEQTTEESHIGVMQLWFWTDRVEITEGGSRQVDMECEVKGDALSFKISK